MRAALESLEEMIRGAEQDLSHWMEDSAPKPEEVCLEASYH